MPQLPVLAKICDFIMLFSLYDLYCFKTRTGRYGPNAVGTFMSMGFEDSVPDEIVEILVEGDVIFTQRMNSLTSWAIMYFSSSHIDHVAGYAGDGRVIHMTLAGARLHSIQALAQGARLLPVRFGKSDKAKPFDQPADATEEFYVPGFPWSKFSPKIQFAWGGVRILLGLHPDRYRIKHVIDLFVLTLIMDVMLHAFNINLFVTFGVVILGIIGAFNMARLWLRRKRGGKITYLSHPDLGYRSFSQIGGIMFSNMGPLVIEEFGVLPIDFFLTLSKSTDDSTPDEFKEIGKSVRHVAKRWGWIPSINQSEDK